VLTGILEISRVGMVLFPDRLGSLTISTTRQ
jgi:hypothetical protein